MSVMLCDTRKMFSKMTRFQQPGPDQPKAPAVMEGFKYLRT